MGFVRKMEKDIFTRACSGKTRGSCFKWKVHRFRSDIRKNFFMMRAVRHRKMFPREAVDVPSLGVFNVSLDGALSNLV